MKWNSNLLLSLFLGERVGQIWIFRVFLLWIGLWKVMHIGWILFKPLCDVYMCDACARHIYLDDACLLPSYFAAEFLRIWDAWRNLLLDMHCIDPLASHSIFIFHFLFNFFFSCSLVDVVGWALCWNFIDDGRRRRKKNRLYPTWQL